MTGLEELRKKLLLDAVNKIASENTDLYISSITYDTDIYKFILQILEKYKLCINEKINQFPEWDDASNDTLNEMFVRLGKVNTLISVINIVTNAKV